MFWQRAQNFPGTKEKPMEGRLKVQNDRKNSFLPSFLLPLFLSRYDVNPIFEVQLQSISRFLDGESAQEGFQDLLRLPLT